MTTTRPLTELLPKEMTELRVQPFFSLLLEVQPPIVVGKTPALDRRIGIISGGRFEGERLRGTLLPGGSDWQTVRGGDGAWLINVRIVLKTDDDAIIGMPYTGIRHGPQGSARPHRPGRGGQGHGLLFPHRRLVRDLVGEVRLAQQHRQHRRRPPVARGADLSDVRGALAVGESPQAHSEMRE